jgi:sortase A
MTLTDARTTAPSVDAHRQAPAGGAMPPAPSGHSVTSPEETHRSIKAESERLVAGAVLGGFVLVLVTAVVLYGIGPMIEAREQHKLIAAESAQINDTLGQENGLTGIQLPTQPPVTGSTVGIMVIPALRLQAAVLEGASSSQTMEGLGHVPGTAGLGQPGNATVVGRRAGFGGPFAKLDRLVPGDRIMTATIEGQSVYRVRSVKTVIGIAPESRVYGQGKADQLTLVSSASDVPWNTKQAVVVVAVMKGTPFTPTPQESLNPSQLGNAGDSGAWAELVLALLAMGALIVGAVALYRRSSTRSAYLLSTPPLLACTVLAVEAASRLLPAWL